MLPRVTAVQMKELCPGGVSDLRHKWRLPPLPAGAGVDRREGEEHQGPAVHHAHGAVGRGDQVEACEYGRPGDPRAGEEGVQAGCARRSPRQGKAGLPPAASGGNHQPWLGRVGWDCWVYCCKQKVGAQGFCWFLKVGDSKLIPGSV